MWLFCFVLFCMLRSLIAYLVKEQLAGGAAWRICDVISPLSTKTQQATLCDDSILRPIFTTGGYSLCVLTSQIFLQMLPIEFDYNIKSSLCDWAVLIKLAKLLLSYVR